MLLQSKALMNCCLMLGVIAAPSVLEGHSVDTHKNLAAAISRFLASSGDPRFQCETQLSNLLEDGAEREDSENTFNAPAVIRIATGRFLFHFAPKVKGDIAINLLAGSTIDVETTCSALDWGFYDSDPNDAESFCSAELGNFLFGGSNQHAWADAVDRAQNPDLDGWTELGYVLHLLENLTSPAHTRNDPHPHPLDSDPVEAFELFGNNGRLPDQPSGDISTLIDVDEPPQEYFTELATRVRQSFFSADTVDPSWGPAGVRHNQDEYEYGYCLSGFPSGPGTACPDGYRKIAHKGWRFYTHACFLTGGSLPNPFTCGLTEQDWSEYGQYATVNKSLADEQWSELGPLAIQYGASFLRYYVDATNPQLPSCGVTPSLVAHWDFEDVTGTTVPDVTGNDHDGTTFGGPTLAPSSVAGGSQAMQFSAGKAVEVPGSADLLPGKHDYTLSAWFKTSVTGVPQAIVWPQVGCCGNTSVLQLDPTDHIRWSYHDNRIVCCEEPNRVDVESPGAVADGEWHHVVIVRDRSAGLARMYVDGLEAATSPDSEANITTSSVFAIGHRSINALGFREPGRFFQGLLDEIKIWNGALSASQIMNLYNAEKP